MVRKWPKLAFSWLARGLKATHEILEAMMGPGPVEGAVEDDVFIDGVFPQTVTYVTRGKENAKHDLSLGQRQ